MPAMTRADEHLPEDLPVLLQDLLARVAGRWPQHRALTHGDQHLSYAEWQAQVTQVAGALVGWGVRPGDRVLVWLDKGLAAVVASFAVVAAGAVLVPANPLLKPAQVQHMLADTEATLLITQSARARSLHEAGVGPLTCLLTDAPPSTAPAFSAAPTTRPLEGWACHDWTETLAPAKRPAVLPRGLETDTAAIFYTSGSTGQPKGVVLSHRNLVLGAQSVAGYLGNGPDDTLLALLPLSFDAGFSQLTTACWSGARVVLLNYLLPRDVLLVLERERVTGLTAVPPLYQQLVAQDWPEGAGRHLRYWANTGGRLPRATFERLRQRLPQARPYLMYGLTEAFRATYLPPEEADRRPDSIGRAIPQAEVWVLRPDGTPCDPDEPGELVQRGPLVAQGYWRRPAETAARFRPFPADLLPGRTGLADPERAVYSGDTVRRDADGFLYFVGRRDAMIKTSGYRVSPTEVEEVLNACPGVDEAVVYGVPDEALGQAIHAAVATRDPALAQVQAHCQAHCRAHLPAYMWPRQWHVQTERLPRTPNGKIDRQHWQGTEDHGHDEPI